mmetsp:Transcript_55147/g.124692  ORF Transcript_55147/g.124692 Transcript_55147/m.124692 type:complete len:227 (+) Transcript_55147:1747-2427(+)
MLYSSGAASSPPPAEAPACTCSAKVTPEQPNSRATADLWPGCSGHGSPASGSPGQRGSPPSAPSSASTGCASTTPPSSAFTGASHPSPSSGSSSVSSTAPPSQIVFDDFEERRDFASVGDLDRPLCGLRPAGFFFLFGDTFGAVLPAAAARAAAGRAEPQGVEPPLALPPSHPCAPLCLPAPHRAPSPLGAGASDGATAADLPSWESLRRVWNTGQRGFALWGRPP